MRLGRAQLWEAAASVVLATACTYDVPDVAESGAASTSDGSVPESSAPGPDASHMDATLPDSTSHPDGGFPSGDSALGHDVPVGPACAPIAWKATTQVTAESTTFALPAPASLAPGDLLLAYLASYVNATVTLTLTPPPGWTPVGPSVRQLGAFGGSSFLDVYGKIAGPSEPASYPWTASRKVEAVAWILDYAGVNPTSPFEQASAQGVNTGTVFSTPGVSTSAPGELLVATFASTTVPPAKGWQQLPPGTTQRALVTDGIFLGGASDDRVQAAAGDAGVFVSEPEAEAGTPGLGAIITHVVALRPCP